MFTKFNLNVKNKDVSQFYEIGQEHFKRCSKSMAENLDKFTRDKHIIDGKALQDSWFSTNEKFDVFLSHSHKDEDLAIGLAGFLHEKLGLSAFIDSCLWRCSDDLLRMIDDEYCIIPHKNTYSYRDRNYTTSHVHMMLSIALMHMIDKCEAFFLISTSNSICLSEWGEDRQTVSPWIYHELSVASMLLPKRPERWPHKIVGLYESMQELPRFRYPIEKELESFHELSMRDLEGAVKVEGHALDYIYKIKRIKTI